MSASLSALPFMSNSFSSSAKRNACGLRNLVVGTLQHLPCSLDVLERMVDLDLWGKNFRGVLVSDSLRIYNSSVSSAPNTWMDSWIRAIFANAAAPLSSGVRRTRSCVVGF